MRHELTAPAGGLIILLAGLFIYQPLLLPANPDLIYPWGSDSWGHLAKAIYLEQQISQGHFYPDLFPEWYSGVQLLRHLPPLPYYLLAGLLQITGNIWWAGNLFLFLIAVGGGLSFLLYQRWLGWLPAVAVGVLFMGLPDNLRVAFAQGDLPHALAAALLPLSFYFFLKLTNPPGSPFTKEEPGGVRRWDFLGVAVCVALMVLCHAMMAIIFVVCCGLFALLAGLLADSSAPSLQANRGLRGVGRGALAVAAGLLLSGWWLLPSLTGGVAEMGQQAASDAVGRFPVVALLNPSLRASDPEAFYLSLSLVVGLGLAVVFWKRLDSWLKALTVTAFVATLIGSTIASGLYHPLPLHQLFWPVQFLSFAGFAMLLVVVGLASRLWSVAGLPKAESSGRVNASESPRTRGRLMGVGTLGLLVLVVADFSPSLGLVHGRAQPDTLVRISHRLKELPGWRVATTDLGRLGSAPSYLFSYPGGREQVFGGAFQSSITAPLLDRINEGMVTGYEAYAVDRLSLLGTDDVVVLRQPELPGAFPQALQDAGFRLDQADHDLQLYHRDGAPRAHTIPHRVLGIGRGAHNLAMVFPQVVVGGSDYVDDYDQTFLDQFDQLFLSGFKWRSKEDAEAMVQEFMRNGGQRVVVDLTGVSNDILSQRPKFLGVYGEPIISTSRVSLSFQSQEAEAVRELPLLPFDAQVQPWHTLTPQGIDEILIEFTHPLATGTALGVRQLGENRVHFVGLNVVYHALLTRDPVAVGLLEELFGLDSGQVPARKIIPLNDYQADPPGYRFTYRTSKDAPALVPVSHHAGTRVYIDGQLVPSQGTDQLTLVTLKGGFHQVEIRSGEAPLYQAGRAATAMGLLLVAAYCAGLHRRRIPFLVWRGKRTSPQGAGG